MARPLKEIDEKLVERLASIHCTNIEIAAIVECSVDTLDRRFADLIAKAKANGKMSLRRMQWELASKGNATMQIFLGKAILGQTDMVQMNVNGDLTIHRSKEQKDFIDQFKKELEASSNERKQSSNPSREKGSKD